MKKTQFLWMCALALLFGFVSCDNELDLPEAGSIEDLTPPSANFSFVGGEDFDNFLDFQFGNLSEGALNYLWTFGDGTTSTEFEPIHTFPEEGTFTVTLESSDALGAIATFTQDVLVFMPDPPSGLTPVILEPGFENGNDSRDVWSNSDLGGVIQITTSSNFHIGSFGAKLPPDGSRIGYQVIGEFTPNRDYILSYRYTFRDQDESQNGNFTVAMTTPFSNPSDFESSLIDSEVYTEDVAGVGNLLLGINTFNSGNNTELAIYFTNSFDEAYIDSFEIELVE